MPNIPPKPTPVHVISAATGLLSVNGKAGGTTGAWGYVGPAGLAPAQNSTPPVNCGVLGEFETGTLGALQGTAGVVGISGSGFGVWGYSGTENGVHGDSDNGDAVVGIARASGKAGVLGISPNGNGLAGISERGTGIFAQGGQWAASFLGNVKLDGHIQCTKELFCGDPNKPAVTISPSGTVSVTNDVILANQDCAEDFDVTREEEAAPGTVMVIDDEGALQPCCYAYDKKVAGVISGAGEFKPGIVLGRSEPIDTRKPVALMGKVYCKVDAQNAPIEVGDLLTTSDSRGHAMKVTDPLRAFGAVIGKALKPLAQGRGLIPVLVALQ